MARKKRKLKTCSNAGRKTAKTGNSYAASTLAKCRWRKPGARKKQSRKMKAWHKSKK